MITIPIKEMPISDRVACCGITQIGEGIEDSQLAEFFLHIENDFSIRTIAVVHLWSGHSTQGTDMRKQRHWARETGSRIETQFRPVDE